MAGHHIINDTIYGAFAVENMTGRYLHALSAKFVHPVSGEEVVVSTRYPDWAAGV
jgi:23S rRNA-/tRNA-specific pseudouridylate synthase